MELQSTFPLAGGITGAVAVGLNYNKASNRLVDNIVMPIGGFLAGAQAGGIASDVLADVPMKEKLFSVGAKLLVLGCGFAGFSLWNKDSKHTDAGSVGIGILSSIGAEVLLTVAATAAGVSYGVSKEFAEVSEKKKIQ